jgi:peptidoglycan/xylan/chitin deacetylase (PgdA/CDA1 family)
MSATDLLVWREAGMEVGAHTRTHPRLTDCSDEMLVDEVAGSKAKLEAILKEPITQFCYPYGLQDERVRNAVSAAGFSAAVTTRRGRARNSDNRFALPRVPVHGNRGLVVFPFRVLTSYADRR